MDFWLAISFFFAGALLSRFIARVLDVSHTSVAYGQLEVSVLTMLAAADKDLISLLELKYKALDAAEIPLEVINKIRKVDERLLAEWRDAVIGKVIYSLPPSFYRYVKFRNWEEAKRVIQERRSGKNG
jgi:hypothetical protein